jgi:hypothetical protein
MALPVLFSRIQNRRGTQNDFNTLYIGVDPILGSTNPALLQPGELAVVTDSENVYIGTIPLGTYFKITSASGFIPLQIVLAPVASYTTIPALTTTTLLSLLNIDYSVADTDLSTIKTGITFSRNGELQVTSITTGAAATLTDNSTELNSTAYALSFIAIQSGSTLEIQYKHNFTGNLYFNTVTQVWAAI